MTPIDILENAILAGLSDHHRLRYATPGSVVAGMSGEARAVLGGLRSTDIASVRQDVVALYVNPDPTRELKLRFDRMLCSV